MKIIVDRIDEHPGHAISRADVRVVLSSVPAEWSEHLKVVRLSSSRSAASMALYAHVSSGDTLTIASRGHTKEKALRCMLAEMAAHALGFKHRTFQHLQARYQTQVESLVAPLMAELLPQLSRKTVSMSHDAAA